MTKKFKENADCAKAVEKISSSMEEAIRAQKSGLDGQKSMIRDAKAFLLHFKQKILSWKNSNYAVKQDQHASFAQLVDLYGLISKDRCWDSGTISLIVEVSNVAKFLENIPLIPKKFLFAAWILVSLLKN